MKAWVTAFSAAILALIQIDASARELMIFAPAHAYVFSIDKPEKIVEVIKGFNRSLHDTNTPGSVDQCSMIVDLPKAAGGRGDSYGAICNHEDGKAVTPVFLCNDDLVGNFWITKGFTDTVEWKVQAIYDHCFGG